MKAVLITLTGPTCSGKTTILNELITNWSVTPIISTTTRPARPGEVNGKDYHFISEEESKKIEADNGFVELVTYGGTRYGVTKNELTRRAQDDLLAIVLEPGGVREFERLAPDYGLVILKVFVDAPLERRAQRLYDRTLGFLRAPISQRTGLAQVQRAFDDYNRRLQAMLTCELTWRGQDQWDEVIDGCSNPALGAAKIITRALACWSRP